MVFLIIPGHELRGLFVFVLIQSVCVTIIGSILFGGGVLKSSVEHSSRDGVEKRNE